MSRTTENTKSKYVSCPTSKPVFPATVQRLQHQRREQLQHAGTTKKWTIDRTWPIEEIIIIVNFTVNTGGLTLNGTVTTPDLYDGLATLLQHVNLSIDDGTKPRSVVDSSGIGLIEYCYRKGMNLDQGTLQVLAYSQTYQSGVATGARR